MKSFSKRKITTKNVRIRIGIELASATIVPPTWHGICIYSKSLPVILSESWYRICISARIVPESWHQNCIARIMPEKLA